MKKKDFENPKPLWKYQGKFSIVATVNLKSDGKAFLPGVTISKNIMKVDPGTIQAGIGTFCFTSGVLEHRFSGIDTLIKCILDGEGNLLWVNPDYWEEIVGTPLPD